MTLTVLKGGSVFDGTGRRVVRADVAFARGRFVAVGRDLRGDVHVDARGRTVLPGFVDCHVDVLRGFSRAAADPLSGTFYGVVERLSALLDCGITTARDGGRADPGLRQALAEGLIEGPRLHVSIEDVELAGAGDDAWGLDGERSSARAFVRPGQLVAGADEVRRAARAIARAGADYLRLVCPDPSADGDAAARAELPFDELEAGVREAQAARLPVAVHAVDGDAIRQALRVGGVRSIEHGGELDGEAAAALAAARAWLVPALSALRSPDALGQLLATGGRIAMGSAYDADCGDNLSYLAALAALGVPAEQVLVAATSAGAAALSLAGEVGTIAPGARADAVIVDGDPFELRSLRRRIRTVFQDGVQVRG